MNQELVHIKFDYEETLNNKKQLLLSQKNMLRLIRILRQYKELRIKELKLKQKLNEKLTTTSKNIKQIEKIFPKLKQEKPKKIDEVKKLDKIIKNEEEIHEKTIEEELKQIQKKLSAIK